MLASLAERRLPLFDWPFYSALVPGGCPQMGLRLFVCNVCAYARADLGALAVVSFSGA